MEDNNLKPSEKVKHRKNMIVGCLVTLIAIVMYITAIYFSAGKG